MSVEIHYIVGETVKSSFMNSTISELVRDRQRRLPLISGIYARPGQVLIARSRNLAVVDFLTRDQAEWLWFLDADIVIQKPHTLELMLASANGPCVVAAEYFTLNRDKVVSLWRRLEPLSPTHVSEVEIESCGMGCTIIHRDVLLTMLDLDDDWSWFGHDIDPESGTHMGEDYTFCHRAREHGFKIMGAPVVVGHDKSRLLTDFDIV